MAVIDFSGLSIRGAVITRGAIVIVIFALVARTGQGCGDVQDHFRSRGFPQAVLPTSSTFGPVCGENSCCGPQFEQRLVIESRNHTDRFIRTSITRLVTLFEIRAKRFDEFFRDLLTKSHQEFHEMFRKTYGAIYLQNAYVFNDFFGELEKYYSKGKVRLDDTLDTFFSILYQRMFTVLNSGYQFNDTYLGCVAEHMADLKPFDDVPHKLGVQLRRSFVATRTFYLALQKGAVVAENMLAMRLEEECGKEIAEMRYCGLCRRESNPRACLGHCTGVVEKCLRHLQILDSDWNKYIDAIDKVADRLVGPFNIEMVVEPINIKISEAIMTFQEKGAEVSQRIFTGCGKPSLQTRRRRGTEEREAKIEDDAKANAEIVPETLNFPKKKHKKTEQMPTLEKLIREIKGKVKEVRQFWSHLPYQFCNEENITVSPNGTCWNGTGPLRPPGTTQSPPSLVQEQIFLLNVMYGKLQGAYQGQDVDLADDETEEPLDGSGSGSGSGPLEGGSGEGEIEAEAETPAPTAPPMPSTTRSPSEKTRKTEATSGVQSITLGRALLSYLLPIVVVWFGGAITDLL